MRNLSEQVRRAIYAQESDEVFAPLLTITHPDLANPIRIVGDTQGVTKAGDSYNTAPFYYELPDDQEGRIQKVKIKIANVSRELVAMIRTISTAPDVKFEIVRISDPDDVVAGPYEFRLDNVAYDDLTIEGELGRKHRLEIEYPKRAYSYVPANFPGMF